jgi:hypothetical protein
MTGKPAQPQSPAQSQASSRPRTSRKPRQQAPTSPAGPVKPPGKVPPQRLPLPAKLASWEWALTSGEVLSIVSKDDVLRNRVHAGLTFGRGAVFTQDGKPVLTPAGETLVLTAYRQKSKSEDGTLAKVLWEGTISVDDSRLAYEITPDRVIDAESGIRTVTVTTIDRNSNRRALSMSVAVSRKMQQTEWLDPLGIVAVESPAMVGKYIRALTDGLPDPGSSVYGQGPIYTPEGPLILATASGCYGLDGQPVTGWKVDLSTLNPVYLRGMHDVKPERAPDDVKAGIGHLLSLLTVSADYPEVPAAHIGQLLVSVLAPIDARYFTAIWLHALRGTGKTYFESLITAIQSPDLRDLRQVKPELNLGDMTGTTKGPKYRVPAFGLGTVTADDVFKAIHSPIVQAQRTEMADALIRSYEGGAAAIGHVDKMRNRVTSKASGQLCASIRVTAEGPPPSKSGAESSTADRVILQGGWVTPWHTVFDTETFGTLSAPTAIEAMFTAYSEITLHVWSHQPEIAETYTEALSITSAWSMGSERVRSRYTPAVCGLLVLRDQAVKHGFEPTCVDQAIKALETAATKQTAPETVADLAKEFRTELRMALRDGSVCAVGRPVRSLGGEQGTYISPYRKVSNPDDEDLPLWVWPDGVEHESDLGLKIDGANARPKRDSAIELYVRPPQRTAQGGRNKATQHQWSLIAPTGSGTFALLCRVMTARRARTDGMIFEPDQVITALTAIEPGFKAKIRYYAQWSDDGVGLEDQTASPSACVVIPTGWLFAPDSESEI